MLFRVNAKKLTFELNPELKAILEFERLTDRQMTYIILATDYKSPFRKLTPEDRRIKAALTAGYKHEKDGKTLDMNTRNLINGKTPSVEVAIKKYRELQRDEDYETLLSISNLIGQIREVNNKKGMEISELVNAVKLTTGLDKLMETKKKLEEILDMREDTLSDTAILSDDDSIDEANLPPLQLINDGLV